MLNGEDLMWLRLGLAGFKTPSFAEVEGAYFKFRGFCDELVEYFESKFDIASENYALEHFARLSDFGGGFLHPKQDKYPRSLKNIKDAPLVLFYKGNIELLNNRIVGIVGCRNPTISAANQTTMLAAKLGGCGITVASGFAKGVDTAACKGALKYGTIQVLASGLDIIYPSQNTRLYDEVLQNGGLFITEYRLNRGCQRWVGGGEKMQERMNFTNFPRRNRIISGISTDVVITQAFVKSESQFLKRGLNFLLNSNSGSLNTAHHVINQGSGRRLFALPGSPMEAESKVCNHLISIKLAWPLLSVDDILKNGEPKHVNIDDGGLFSEHVKNLNNNDNDYNQILHVLSSKPSSAEDISTHLQIAIELVITNLTELELDGKVQRTPQGQFVKQA